MAYVTGDRKFGSFVTFSHSGDITASDGRFTSESSQNWYFNTTTVSGAYWQWDFGVGNSYACTSFLFVQQTTASHGTWKIQGSNDGSSWTDLGSSFTLGGAKAAGYTWSNSTAYRYYRLAGVSGSSSGSPFIVSAMLGGASGQPWRTSQIDIYATGTVFNQNHNSDSRFVVDGNFGNPYLYLAGGGSVTSASRIIFGLPDSTYVSEAKTYHLNTNTYGTWKWQGSNDFSSWSDIGSSFTWGGATTQTHTQLNGNTTAYKWLQLIGVSGTTSAEYFYEIEFDETTVTPPAVTRKPMPIFF